ncbi:MAG: hypothetical protein KBT36_08725 [Kurthia sp.]|nr:hypothetical protein [Candidatus Kurthia equi]
MKFNWVKMKASADFMKKVLGIETIEVKDKQIALSEDQRATIEEKLGAEQASKLFEKMNEELQAAENESQEMLALQNVLKEISGEDKSATTVEGAEKQSTTAQAAATIKALKEENDIMAKQSVGDAPLTIFQNPNLKQYAASMIPQHTATHLFGDNSEFQALANRPWNERMVSGSAKATTFGSSELDVLQGDLEHFIRQNPTALVSFYNDFEGLPEEWSKTPGVADRITTASITFGEVTQARKDGWQPKGGISINVEIGQVYAKQIDLEWSGAKLQSLETTWLASIQNMDGSHPWKMSFIGFLLMETIKQRLLEDRNAQINGIYVPTPANVAGNAVNAQDGILIRLFRAIHQEKIVRVFPLGKPTLENIVDYVDQFMKNVPEEILKLQGLELGMSNAWKLAYLKALGDKQVLVFDEKRGVTTSTINHVVNRPNIKLQALADMVDTDFMYLTLSKNIDQLSYIPEEADKFTIGHDRRDTWAFADYKTGIRFQYIGLKLAKDFPNKYAAQVVFCNDMPVFGPNVTFPAYDYGTGMISMYYAHAKVDANFSQDIVDMDKVVPGQVIKITGNTKLASAINVKKNDKFLLGSDFNLKSGGTLTLLVKADLTLKELSRTTSAPVIEDVHSFDNTVIDANDAIEFKFVGAEAKSLATILNGVDNKQIKITAGPAALTVVNSATISIGANAVLKANSTDFISLIYVDGVWYEVAKQITA